MLEDWVMKGIGFSEGIIKGWLKGYKKLGFWL
jgi:hypothetical protein